MEEEYDNGDDELTLTQELQSPKDGEGRCVICGAFIPRINIKLGLRKFCSACARDRELIIKLPA